MIINYFAMIKKNTLSYTLHYSMVLDDNFTDNDKFA